jgi:hypothetical protein
MKDKLLHFIVACTALLFVGLCPIHGSPVSLGNASQFAALALNGNVANASGTITGPVGVASSGFSYSGNSTFKSNLYVNTGDTITLGGAAPSNTFQNAATNTFLSQAITNANNASSTAAAQTPTQNLGNINGNVTVPQTAVGNYVYTVGTVNNNSTLTVSAPAGSTVIVNITGGIIPAGNAAVTLNIAGGLTPNDVIWNVLTPSTINQGGGKNITGILLAPTSTVTINGGATVTGQVIAMSVTTTGSGLITFAGPVVPEPSTLSVVAIGSAVLLGHRFLWKRRTFG